MDVLHLTHQYAPETRGGVESYVTELVAEQRAAGLDAQVLTGTHQPRARVTLEALEVAGVPVHRLHRDDLFFDHHVKGWHPGVERALDEFLARTRPRLVHVHQWIRLTSNVVELVKRRGLPVVLTLHDYYSSCPRAFRMRPGASACLRPLSVESCLDCVPRYGHESAEELADGIRLFRDQMAAELGQADVLLVAVSSTAEIVGASLGLARERFHVLPLGHRERFGAVRLAPPVAGAPFRFAYWGSVGRHKGITVLIEAFRRLCAAAPAGALELHVLGGFERPEFEAELRTLAQGLPLTFHGPFRSEELPALAPHAGVFPSTCLETFGLVLDECFELGLPCIVSDHGALAARAGQAALRARPGDAAHLAELMARLVAEPATWHALRAAIPRHVPSVAEHCRELARLYEQARIRAREPHAEPLPAERRIALLWRQRESALARLTPPGGPR
jgi:glycosyltransferase involved in cell wall biosynthesis